jgi:hypothetical protein
MMKMMSAIQRQESSMVNTFLMLLYDKVDKHTVVVVLLPANFLLPPFSFIYCSPPSVY